MNEQTKLIIPRNSALEGLRGVFCIAVFNSHIIPNFYPEIMNSGTWKVVMDTPLYLFFSGGAGISFFALLIGMTFMGNIQAESYFVMLKKCIKRYFKFVIIIFVCNNLYWIFSYFGLLYCVHGTDYQDIVYFPKMDIVLPYWRVFTDSFGRIFFKGTSSFVAPFHTIGDLYWGAWIVLVLYSFLLKIKNILDHKLFFVFGNITCLVWSMLFFWLGKNIFFECIIGLWSMMFYEYFQNKQEINSSRKRNSNSMVIGISGLFIIQLSAIWKNIELNNIIDYTYLVTFGLAPIMMLIKSDRSSSFAQFLSNKIFVFLGYISFALYGIHWIVITSIGTKIMMSLLKRQKCLKASVYLVCLIISVIVSWGITTFDNHIQKKMINPLFVKFYR